VQSRDILVFRSRARSTFHHKSPFCLSKPNILQRYARLVSAAEAGEKVGSLKASTAGVPADAVLRLGRGLAEQLISVRERSGLPIHIHDMYQKDEDEVLETVCRLCRESDRPLIVTAKNNERLCEELIAARQRGKRVVTLVSARSA
jgi:hypothetical protein